MDRYQQPSADISFLMFHLDESNLFFKGLTTYNISKSFDVSGPMTALQPEPIIRSTKMIINSGAQFTVNKEIKASIDPSLVNYGQSLLPSPCHHVNS